MSKIRILLVEDAVGLPITKVLETWGYQTDLAEDGETGWEMLNRKSYDMLLVDWMLPGISGVELVERVRGDSRWVEMPIVMISGKAGREDIVAAVGSGIDSYLAKPFTATQIRDKINSVLEKGGESRDLKAQIRRVVDNQLSIDSDSERPLVIFGERFDTVDELSHQDQREAVTFLCSAIRMISSINSENPDLNLGYAIKTSTGQIVDQLKEEAVQERVRAVVLSSECSGSPVLMARLLRENFATEVPILVSCGDLMNLSPGHRSGLEKFSIPILERPEMAEDEIKEALADRICPPGKLSSSQTQADGERAE